MKAKKATSNELGGTPKRFGKANGQADRMPALAGGELAENWGLTAGAAIVVLAVFVAAFHVKIIDADVLMHLRTGRLIAETGSVPRTDPYSATAQGAEWVDHEWLWQWLAHWVYTAGGWIGLSVARLAAIGVGLLFCVAAARHRGVKWIHSLAACLVAFCPLMAFAEIRPQTASFLFFPILLWLLETAPDQPRRLWVLPVLFLAWANLHGAFIIGFVLAGCYAAGWMIENWRDRAAVVDRKCLFVIGAVVLSVVASLINPYGLKALTFSSRVVKYAFITQHIYEWAPPEFTRFFVPFMLMLAVSVILAFNARRRLKPGDWVLQAVFGFFALRMRRQIAFFPLAVFPALAVGISELSETLRARNKLRARLGDVLVALIAFCLVAVSFALYSNARAPFGSGLAPGRFPVLAAQKLEDSAAGGAVFNDYNDGGYLIWRLWPKWKVAIDGRVDVYGPEAARMYQQTWKGNDWKVALDSMQARAILGRREILRASPAHNLYTEIGKDPNWKVDYQDKLSLLYLRQPLTQTN